MPLRFLWLATFLDHWSPHTASHSKKIRTLQVEFHPPSTGWCIPFGKQIGSCPEASAVIVQVFNMTICSRMDVSAIPCKASLLRNPISALTSLSRPLSCRQYSGLYSRPQIPYSFAAHSEPRWRLPTGRAPKLRNSAIKRYLIGLCEMQFSAQTTDKADADCDGGDLRASENERRGTLARFSYVARSPCVAAEFHGDLLM